MRPFLIAIPFIICLNSIFLGLNRTSQFSSILVASQHPAETILFLNLGMRRVAADLAMIRLLIYYGEHEELNDEMDAQKQDGHQNALYPEMGPRAERIMALDPSFNYPVLYASGALAFNLGRPNEALDLLKKGLLIDPQNTQYKAYAAAIAFSTHGDPEKVVEALNPYLKDKDCPSMLKNIVAFLYLRLGQTTEAMGLYKDLLSSRDKGYRELAARMLGKLKRAPHLKIRRIFKK